MLCRREKYINPWHFRKRCEFRLVFFWLMVKVPRQFFYFLKYYVKKKWKFNSSFIPGTLEKVQNLGHNSLKMRDSQTDKDWIACPTNLYIQISADITQIMQQFWSLPKKVFVIHMCYFCIHLTPPSSSSKSTQRLTQLGKILTTSRGGRNQNYVLQHAFAILIEQSELSSEKEESTRVVQLFFFVLQKIPAFRMSVIFSLLVWLVNSITSGKTNRLLLGNEQEFGVVKVSQWNMRAEIDILRDFSKIINRLSDRNDP